MPSLVQQSLDALIATHTVAFKVMADRIYIAEDLEKMNALHRFLDILEELRNSQEDNEATDKLSGLMNEIIALARKTA